jgi:hypothetical protein
LLGAGLRSVRDQVIPQNCCYRAGYPATVSLRDNEIDELAGRMNEMRKSDSWREVAPEISKALSRSRDVMRQVRETLR